MLIPWRMCWDSVLRRRGQFRGEDNTSREACGFLRLWKVSCKLLRWRPVREVLGGQGAACWGVSLRLRAEPWGPEKPRCFRAGGQVITVLVVYPLWWKYYRTQLEWNAVLDVPFCTFSLARTVAIRAALKLFLATTKTKRLSQGLF